MLNDAVILKDILRQYEGQETHTVHLVYTPKNYYNQKPFVNKAATTKKDAKPMTPPQQQPTQQNNNQQTQQQSASNASGSDGLR